MGISRLMSFWGVVVVEWMKFRFSFGGFFI